MHTFSKSLWNSYYALGIKDWFRILPSFLALVTPRRGCSGPSRSGTLASANRKSRASALCGFLGNEQQEARGLFHKHKGCTVSSIHPHYDLKSSRKRKPALFQKAHLLVLLQENGVQEDVGWVLGWAIRWGSLACHRKEFKREPM